MFIKMYCYVRDCPNSSKNFRDKKKDSELTTYFSVPEDKALLEKWRRVIPRNDKVLSQNDRLCDLHFLTCEVQWFTETKLPNGNVRRLLIDKPVLRPGTIPSIFPPERLITGKSTVKTTPAPVKEKTETPRPILKTPTVPSREKFATPKSIVKTPVIVKKERIETPKSSLRVRLREPSVSVEKRNPQRVKRRSTILDDYVTDDELNLVHGAGASRRVVPVPVVKKRRVDPAEMQPVIRLVPLECLLDNSLPKSKTCVKPGAGVRPSTDEIDRELKKVIEIPLLTNLKQKKSVTFKTKETVQFKPQKKTAPRAKTKTTASSSVSSQLKSSADQDRGDVQDLNEVKTEIPDIEEELARMEMDEDEVKSSDIITTNTLGDDDSVVIKSEEEETVDSYGVNEEMKDTVSSFGEIEGNATVKSEDETEEASAAGEIFESTSMDEEGYLANLEINENVVGISEQGGRSEVAAEAGQSKDVESQRSDEPTVAENSKSGGEKVLVDQVNDGSKVVEDLSDKKEKGTEDEGGLEETAAKDHQTDGDAKVSGGHQTDGDAKVSGDHQTDGIAKVSDHQNDGIAKVSDHQTDGIPKVSDHQTDGVTKVSDHQTDEVTKVSGNHQIDGEPKVSDHQTDGIANVSDHQTDGIAKVSDHQTDGVAKVSDHQTDGVAKISEDHQTDGVAILDDRGGDKPNAAEATDVLADTVSEVTADVLQSEGEHTKMEECHVESERTYDGGEEMEVEVTKAIEKPDIVEEAAIVRKENEDVTPESEEGRQTPSKNDEAERMSQVENQQDQDTSHYQKKENETTKAEEQINEVVSTEDSTKLQLESKEEERATEVVEAKSDGLSCIHSEAAIMFDENNQEQMAHEPDDKAEESQVAVDTISVEDSNIEAAAVQEENVIELSDSETVEDAQQSDEGEETQADRRDANTVVNVDVDDGQSETDDRCDIEPAVSQTEAEANRDTSLRKRVSESQEADETNQIQSSDCEANQTSDEPDDVQNVEEDDDDDVHMDTDDPDDTEEIEAVNEDEVNMETDNPQEDTTIQHEANNEEDIDIEAEVARLVSEVGEGEEEAYKETDKERPRGKKASQGKEVALRGDETSTIGEITASGVQNLFSPETIQEILKQIKLPLTTPVTLRIAPLLNTPGSSNSGRGRGMKATKRRGGRTANRPLLRASSSNEQTSIDQFRHLTKTRTVFDFPTYISDIDDDIQYWKLCQIIKESFHELIEARNTKTSIGRLTLSITINKPKLPEVESEIEACYEGS